MILRPIGGDSVPTFHSFSQGKLLTVTSRQPLEEDTTYELVLTSGIQDAAGNGMEPYSFRFSTGGGLTGGNTAPTVTSVNADPAITEPGETIDFSWTGFDVEAGTLEYRIDFGDGSPRTEWSTDTDASHAYAEEGHYNVLVQVRDSEGAVGAYSRGVTVALAPDEPNSTASALMVLDSPGSRLYIANPDNDTVTAINTATEETVWEAPTSSHPKSVALANDGTLWVVCRDEDAIDVLNASTGALVQTILLDYGSIPVAIAPVPGGATMLVSTEGAESLLRFSVATRTQTGSVQLGPMPRAIAVTEDGQRALVTRFISAEHSGSVYDVSLAGSMSLTRTINLRRDRGPDGSASARGVPNYLSSVRIGPDGDYAWITCKKDNTTRGTFFSPTQALGQDNTVRAGILLIDLNTNAEDVSMRMDIDNSDSPSAIAFSPLGDYVFVALQGNNRIAVIDMFDFMTPGSPGTVLTHWDTGLAPQGVLADPATDRVFTGDFMDRSVSSFDASQFYASGVAVQSKTTISTVENERLHPEILLGKQIFYNASDSRMSAEGYISCATCHIDGSHDGRTFDFTSRGEGFRNTTDLRGRSGMGHGFVHWSGNFDEIQDFENDIRNEFGGDGFLTDEQFAGTSDTLGSPKAGLNDDLDALAAYVTSLGTKTIQRSPYRQSDGTLSAAAQNGQSIFAAQNCATCHVPGTDYTDRQAHNTGTLKASSGNRLGGALTGIDTPTLLGTFGGAPYFHDGSAATLEDVLTTSGGQLLQAEDAVLSGAAVATSITWLPLKDWHQFELVQFEGAGAITFNNVMSTAAGSGFIEIRYSIQGFATGTATVNGVDTAINFPGTGNNPGYEPNEWRKVRVPVNWNAGSNTVAISRNFGGVAVDDVLMMTAGDLVSANDHVRGLNAGDMADLIEYIQSLDGTNAATPDLSLTRDLTPIVSGATDELEPPGDASEFIITYVIENTGDGPLNIGQFHIETNPPGAMTIEEHPVPHIEAGEQTVLEIRLTNPSTPATA